MQCLRLKRGVITAGALSLSYQWQVYRLTIGGS